MSEHYKLCENEGCARQADFCAKHAALTLDEEVEALRAKLELARAVVEAARNVCRDGMTQRLIDEIAAFDAAKEKP